MTVKCFLVRPTERAKRIMRRYCTGEDRKCLGAGYSYHNAEGPVLDIVGSRIRDRAWENEPGLQKPLPDDPRWPQKCDGCNYRFTPQDEYQIYVDHIYVDDAGKEYSLRERNLQPGMMWDAWWMPDCWKGPDGRSLIVVLPNGHHWMIDGQATNCTMKDDVGPFEKAHRCWVRHGEPPNLIVDKNGRTCSAGAGSILAGDYHGFLGCNGAPPGHLT